MVLHNRKRVKSFFHVRQVLERIPIGICGKIKTAGKTLSSVFGKFFFIMLKIQHT